MKVLQLVPSLEAGGAERATIDVAMALMRAGHDAVVISAGGAMVADLKRVGAPHVTWPVDSKNPVTILQNALNLRDYIIREGIDVVHVRSRAPAWSALMATRITGTPFVTTFHAAYKGHSPLKRLYNSVMTKSDRIIAISDFIAAHIMKRYGIEAKKIEIIPRGIDFAQFNPEAVTQDRKGKLRRELDLPNNVPVIIMPGRLSPIKGHELALRALARLKEKSFICLMIGPDQGRALYRAELVKLKDTLGLGDKVRLVEKTDLPAAYALAHLVLSPSQVAEGFGRVPVEAQAFGVPVIATRLGATAETVLEGETGWLVPPNDEKALAEAIVHALELGFEARTLMAAQAINFVRARFDVKEMCARTLNVYERVVRERQ